MNRINQQRLIAYRLERGLAVRQVARDCGIEIAVLNRLETLDDPNTSTLSVSQLMRIADHLGIPITDLFANDDDNEHAPPPTESNDPRLLGALLRALDSATSVVVLADSLEWDIPRVHAAAETLRHHLHFAGMTLYKNAGFMSIRPVDDRHADAELAARRHPRITASRSLVTPARARLLYRAAHTPISPHSLSGNDRTNVAVLIKAGLLTENEDRFFIPSQQVVDSLQPPTPN